MPDKVKKVVGLGLVIAGAFFGGPAGAALAMKIVGAGLLASASKPKPVASTTNGTELQLSGDPVDVRTICYGEAWTAGTLRYRNTAGTDNKDLYMVIVLAGHEVDSVQAVEADRQALTLDGSGNVTSPSKWAGIMNVRFYTGSDSQSADSTLDSVFSNWTTDHRLRGLAYAIVKLTFNEESLNTVPAFRFKVRGRKVYDPRLDSTNGGSGSHRLATPSTWAWSRNAVLCYNDFHRGVKVNSINIAGLDLATTRFDWANVIAEANICDENVALAAGGNEDRYTVDGFIDPRQAPGEICRHFDMAIAGEAMPSDGKWRYFAGAYRTPTLSLTDQHFIGPIRYTVHKGELERYDTAEGRYAALAESGTVVNYSPVRLSTATTGSERLLSLDFQLVSDVADSGYDGGARAQRIAKLLLEKEAAGKTIVCTTNLYGLRCMPGETVSVTHAAFGLSSQAMRVLDVQLKTMRDDNGRTGLAVDLTLEAGPSSLYSWSAEESALSPAPSIPQASLPPGIIEGVIIGDPYFRRRAELWDGTGEPDGYYWRKAGDPSFTGGGVSIDLAGGSNDDVGALVLSTNGSTIGWSRALAVGKATSQTIIRAEKIAFKIRLRRTTSVPSGDPNKVFYVDVGRGDGDGFIGEYDPVTGFRLLHADLAALTLNQWYDYEWVSALGETGTPDLHPDYNRCAIEIALNSGDAMTIEVDSIIPYRIGTQKQIGLITNPKTAAESSAGVTPTNYEYPEFHVDRYGADPTGASDSSPAFQSAVSVAEAMGNEGAEIVMGAGTYKISSLVTAPGRVLFRGQGMNATRINAGTGVNPFKFVNTTPTNEIEGGGIEDCSISHDTATIVVQCDEVWGLKFRRVFFRDGGSGSGTIIQATGECFEMRVEDCRFLGADTYCIDIQAIGNSCTFRGNDFAPNNGCTTIRVQEAFDCVIAENRIEYAGSDTGTKIEIDQSNSTVIAFNDITQGTSGFAIVIKTGSHGTKIIGNDFSTSGSGGSIDVQNGDYGVIAGNEFQVSSTSGDQIKAGGRTGWTVMGNTFRVDAALASSGNLILVNSSALGWSIIGNTMVGEGSGANGGTGIQIDAGSIFVNVIGNLFYNLNTGIDTQANNSSPSVLIQGNSFSTLTTKITVGTAASNRIVDNLGYRTQNVGTATIASGTTAITVTHGLDITPDAGRITVTPTANTTTDPGNIWVNNIGATTFDVNCRTDPGTGGMAFAWGAEGL